MLPLENSVLPHGRWLQACEFASDCDCSVLMSNAGENNDLSDAGDIGVVEMQ